MLGHVTVGQGRGVVKTSPHLPPTTLCLRAFWTAWQTFVNYCMHLGKSFMNYLPSRLFKPPFSTFVNTQIADRREHHVLRNDGADRRPYMEMVRLNHP